ncbi:hypothetical protein ACLOJK_004054 [Asimina triloba]
MPLQAVFSCQSIDCFLLLVIGALHLEGEKILKFPPSRCKLSFLVRALIAQTSGLSARPLPPLCSPFSPSPFSPPLPPCALPPSPYPFPSLLRLASLSLPSPLLPRPPLYLLFSVPIPLSPLSAPVASALSLSLPFSSTVPLPLLSAPIASTAVPLPSLLRSGRVRPCPAPCPFPAPPAAISIFLLLRPEAIGSFRRSDRRSVHVALDYETLVTWLDQQYYGFTTPMHQRTTLGTPGAKKTPFVERTPNYKPEPSPTN